MLCIVIKTTTTLPLPPTHTPVKSVRKRWDFESKTAGFNSSMSLACGFTASNVIINGGNYGPQQTLGHHTSAGCSALQKDRNKRPHTHFTFLTSQGMLYAHRSTDPVPSVCAGFAPDGFKHRLYWGVLNIIEPSNHTKAQRQMCCIRNQSFREVQPHTNRSMMKLCMQM